MVACESTLAVKETRAARQWADGERKPSIEVMTRLRPAYHAAALLAERDSRSVVPRCASKA